MSSYHVNSFSNYYFPGNCDDADQHMREYQQMGTVPYQDYSGAAYPIGHGSAYHGFALNNAGVNGGGFLKTHTANDFSRHLPINASSISGSSFRGHVTQTDVYRSARGFEYDVTQDPYGNDYCVSAQVDGVYRIPSHVAGRQRILGTEPEVQSEREFQSRDNQTSHSFPITAQPLLGNKRADALPQGPMSPRATEGTGTGSLSPNSSRSSSPLSSHGESNHGDGPPTSVMPGPEWQQHHVTQTGSGSTHHVYPWMKRIHPTNGGSVHPSTSRSFSVIFGHLVILSSCLFLVAIFDAYRGFQELCLIQYAIKSTIKNCFNLVKFRCLISRTTLIKTTMALNQCSDAWSAVCICGRVISCICSS